MTVSQQPLSDFVGAAGMIGRMAATLPGDIPVTTVPVANYEPQEILLADPRPSVTPAPAGLDVTQQYDPRRHYLAGVPEWSVGGPAPRLNRAQRRAAARQR